MMANKEILHAEKEFAQGTAEVVTRLWDFTDVLNDDETISSAGTPTASPSGPTFGTPAVNAAALTDSQWTDRSAGIAIGKAVTCTVTTSGATVGTLYDLDMPVTTSTTDTRVGRIKLRVQ